MLIGEAVVDAEVGVLWAVFGELETVDVGRFGTTAAEPLYRFVTHFGFGIC